jgi:lysophospholipase L1-like esterase
MMTTATNTRWRFGSRERKKKRKAGGTKNLFLGLFLLFLPLLNHGQSCPPDSIARVMLVGDSWSQFTHLYQSYQRAFTKYGFPEVVALGDRTAIGGTRASDWLTPEYFDLVALEFSLHPEVDLVILCLGGNDLQASDGWRRSQTPAQQDSVFDRIGQRIEQVALAILQLRPDVDILLGGYDYLNFVETLLNYPAGATNPYESTWNRLEQPTVREVNLGLGQLESRKVTISKSILRFTMSTAWGSIIISLAIPTPCRLLLLGALPPVRLPCRVRLRPSLPSTEVTSTIPLLRRPWDRSYRYSTSSRVSIASISIAKHIFTMPISRPGIFCMTSCTIKPTFGFFLREVRQMAG